MMSRSEVREVHYKMALWPRNLAMPGRAVLEICAAIERQGWAVAPGFLPPLEIAALGAEARRRDAAGEFRRAGVGRGANRVERSDIRGDRILWLDEEVRCSAESELAQALDALRVVLNERLFLGLASFEGHYTIYPPATFYRRHRDRFRDDDARVVSCALYLNEDWSMKDGGALRIHLDSGAHDILPAGGTLACFLAER